MEDHQPMYYCLQLLSHPSSRYCTVVSVIAVSAQMGNILPVYSGTINQVQYYLATGNNIIIIMSCITFTLCLQFRSGFLPLNILH